MQQAPTVEVPPPPALPQQPAPVTIQHPGGSPRAVFEAARAKREVLGEYMSRLLNRRENVSDRLHNTNLTPVERTALEEHLQELNTRIIAMEKQIAQSDAEVATAAGIPGSSIPDEGSRPEGPPEEMLIVGTVFTGIAVCILAIAWAR